MYYVYHVFIAADNNCMKHNHKAFTVSYNLLYTYLSTTYM